ncbi:MAG: T9SS type A sorting domain-containing protein [Bacteroidetes bacterium]|nr:T9SS type A sorting domain-containing protein [Bacteroidota bacterium]
MKKKLRIIAFMALIFTAPAAQAQLINPGFETWSNDFLVPSSMNPNSGSGTYGWWDYNCFNYSVIGSSPISVTRCTDTVHGGTYSARLQTRVYTPTSWAYYSNWGTPFIGHPYDDTLGILFNGNVNETAVSYKPGIPFTQRITEFKFYYQYKPRLGDTAECRVLLLKSGAPVAGGVFKTDVATGISGWQQATISMVYVSGLTPDTMYVLFSSSSLDKNPRAGSVLWLDDVSVTLPTGIDQPLYPESDLEIFPNPSNGIFTIRKQTLSNDENTIEIYNALGAKIYSTVKAKQSSYDIDISAFPKGIYFVKFNDGEINHDQKIIVK